MSKSTEPVMVEGHISSAITFADGNHSYTVRDASTQGLFRFTEGTPLTEKGKPLLRGSLIQAELNPVVDEKTGEPVVNDFDRRDGSTGQVAITRLNRWYLIQAATSADEKRAQKPLISPKA